jgi:hypothetical protein
MLRRSFALALGLLAFSASAATGTRKRASYLPSKALHCERAVTRRNPKYCKGCNQEAMIGAADTVTMQIGGCGSSGQGLTMVADFTAADATFYVPVALAGGVDIPGGLELEALTVGDLTVTGTSTHAGLETFNGGIATDTIDPASEADSITIGSPTTTVNIPGGLGDLTVGDLTVGDLSATGTSVHYGLEIFYGDIATDTVYAASEDATVMIPGSGDDSTAIGYQGEYLT